MRSFVFVCMAFLWIQSLCGMRSLCGIQSLYAKDLQSNSYPMRPSLQSPPNAHNTDSYSPTPYALQSLLPQEAQHNNLTQNRFTQSNLTQHSLAQHNLAQNRFMQNRFTQGNSAQSASMQHYSIIQDLRHAFEPYSSSNNQHESLLQAYNATLQNATDSHATISISYANYLGLLDSYCCNISLPQYAINSFDMQDSAHTIAQIYAKLSDTKDKPPQAKPPQPTTQTQHTQAKAHSQPPIDIDLLAPKCRNKKFNIAKDEKLKAHTLLYALAKECSFSIQYTQNSKQNIDKNQSTTFHIHNQPLDFILPILLDNVFYTIESNRLVLSDIRMQMFEINYISSTRMAQSNTDVLFAQEQHEGYGMGYTSYFTPQYNATQSTAPQYNQNTSGYLDNLSLRNQLRAQMSAAHTRFGKSGTKVYSLDEINFWADIESKLSIMLDLNVGDKFMIDKGAGLIAVWTTKSKMSEVERFLSSLEHKMNMQVAIDVEILSLRHFQSNSVGIDWHAIFSVLNPTQSKLDIAFGGGGATLTLGNNNADLQSIFNLLRTYGDLRSLSNPKIMALNNQPALISVGSVLRYTQNLVYQANNTNTTIQNTSTQYPSIFAGILLDITPSISEDSVILRINPSITKTKDPEMENAPQALNAPPNLSTNQLSSIVKLKDGERVIIGGLLSNVTQNTTQAIPKIGENKWLKNVFGKENNIQRSEELIIIITPHIIR